MFEKLFDVFSRRVQSAVGVKTKPITNEFRNRVLMLLRDEVQHDFRGFLNKLHQKAAYLYGKFELSESPGRNVPESDLLSFLSTCKDEHFLDVIELIFRSNLPGITWPDNALIPGINKFFRIDDLPYHLTNYSTEEIHSSFFEPSGIAIQIREYPRVIRKDSELLYQYAMEPTLTLLCGAEFKHANDEFLKALEDHRKGDYRDCLTKCGSAFESVMKVLCRKNSFQFKETDTASALLKTLLSNGQLDQFWEQPLILIATLRNRLSSSHGAGTQPKLISEHVAAYAINATASSILLLCSEFS